MQWLKLNFFSTVILKPALLAKWTGLYITAAKANVKTSLNKTVACVNGDLEKLTVQSVGNLFFYSLKETPCSSGCIFLSIAALFVTAHESNSMMFTVLQKNGVLGLLLVFEPIILPQKIVVNCYAFNTYPVNLSFLLPLFFIRPLFPFIYICSNLLIYYLVYSMFPPSSYSHTSFHPSFQGS